MSLLILSKRQKRVNALHQLVNEVQDNEWNKVPARVRSNPEEVSSLDIYFKQTALHPTCHRYPPIEFIRTMMEAVPCITVFTNINEETPLQLACEATSEESSEIFNRLLPTYCRYDRPRW
jgi:hypothetical protein